MSRFQRRAPAPPAEPQSLVRLTECRRYLINSAKSIETMEAVRQVSKYIQAILKEYPAVAHNTGQLVPCPGCGGRAEWIWEKRRGILLVECLDRGCGCIYYKLVVDPEPEVNWDKVPEVSGENYARKETDTKKQQGFFD